MTYVCSHIIPSEKVHSRLWVATTPPHEAAHQRLSGYVGEACWLVGHVEVGRSKDLLEADESFELFNELCRCVGSQIVRDGRLSGLAGGAPKAKVASSRREVVPGSHPFRATGCFHTTTFKLDVVRGLRCARPRRVRCVDLVPVDGGV